MITLFGKKLNNNKPVNGSANRFSRLTLSHVFF